MAVWVQWVFQHERTGPARDRNRGTTSPRVAVRLQAGMEAYDNYEAGSFDVEDTRPLFASGQLDQRDTIDDNFGFRLNAFADPFNAPYVRTERDSQFVGGRLVHQCVEPGPDWRSTDASAPLSAAANGRHRFPGLRGAVLFQCDVLAAQQSRSCLRAARRRR